MLTVNSIKWPALATRKRYVGHSFQKVMCLLFSAAALSSCASGLAERTDSGTEQAISVKYAAREWAGHNDGRTYGGVVNSPSVLSGILGAYKGCLVEVRSRTLIVLSGAMEFHAPDGHSDKQHIFSKSMLGDRPASIIPLGSRFTVAGMETKSVPSYIRLDQNIPSECAELRVFLTESETLKLK